MYVQLTGVTTNIETERDMHAKNSTLSQQVCRHDLTRIRQSSKTFFSKNHCNGHWLQKKGAVMIVVTGYKSNYETRLGCIKCTF